MANGDTVRADIARRGVTRAAYARLMGVTTDMVYKWLRGDKQSIQTLRLMKLTTEQLEELAKDGKETET